MLPLRITIVIDGYRAGDSADYPIISVFNTAIQEINQAVDNPTDDRYSNISAVPFASDPSLLPELSFPVFPSLVIQHAPLNASQGIVLGRLDGQQITVGNIKELLARINDLIEISPGNFQYPNGQPIGSNGITPGADPGGWPGPIAGGGGLNPFGGPDLFGGSNLLLWVIGGILIYKVIKD